MWDKMHPAGAGVVSVSRTQNLQERRTLLTPITYISTRFTKGEKTPAGKAVKPPSRRNLISTTTTGGGNQHGGPFAFRKPNAHNAPTSCKQAETQSSRTQQYTYADEEWEHHITFQD